MGSLLYNNSANGPTMFLPPQHHTFQTSPFDHLAQSTNSFHYQNQSTSQWNSAAPIRPEPSLRHSKKRSRDSDDVDGDFFQAPRVPTPRPEPIYGEGMTLIDPVSGRPIGCDGQTGTWYEEQLEADRKAAEAAVKEEAAYQARLPKAKRLNSQPALHDLPLSQHEQSPCVQQQPFHLGVDPVHAANPLADLYKAEWLCNSNSEETRMASRGWAKFIEKSYLLLSNPEVLMTYCEAQLFGAPDIKYIVARTNQGFWRFSEDLRQAQKVASKWESCLSSLRQGSYSFAGEQVLMAGGEIVRNADEASDVDEPMGEVSLGMKASSAPEQWQPMSMVTGKTMGKRPLSGGFTAMDRETVRSWREQPGMSSWADTAPKSAPTAFHTTFGEPGGYVSIGMDLD